MKSKPLPCVGFAFLILCVSYKDCETTVRDLQNGIFFRFFSFLIFHDSQDFHFQLVSEDCWNFNEYVRWGCVSLWWRKKTKVSFKCKTPTKTSFVRQITLSLSFKNLLSQLECPRRVAVNLKKFIAMRACKMHECVACLFAL